MEHICGETVSCPFIDELQLRSSQDLHVGRGLTCIQSVLLYLHKPIQQKLNLSLLLSCRLDILVHGRRWKHRNRFGWWHFRQHGRNVKSVSQELNVVLLLLCPQVRQEDTLCIVHQVKELISSEGLLTDLVRVEDVADLENLVLKQIELNSDPLAEVLNTEPLNLNQVLEMVRVRDESALIAHHLHVFLAIVLYFDVRVQITIDIDWGHLTLELLDVVEVLLRDMMDNTVEGALKFVVHRLQQQIETVEAQLVTARQYQHLAVNLVVELVAIRAVVTPSAPTHREVVHSLS